MGMYVTRKAMDNTIFYGEGSELEILCRAWGVAQVNEGSMRWIPKRQNFVHFLVTGDLATDVMPPKHFCSYLWQQLRKSSHISSIQASVWKVGFS